jgi:hypothetical protein
MIIAEEQCETGYDEISSYDSTARWNALLDTVVHVTDNLGKQASSPGNSN